jgi:membrane-bound acyltransferase YfiQ involved in biofilm formation
VVVAVVSAFLIVKVSIAVSPGMTVSGERAYSSMMMVGFAVVMGIHTMLARNRMPITSMNFMYNLSYYIMVLRGRYHSS